MEIDAVMRRCEQDGAVYVNVDDVITMGRMCGEMACCLGADHDFIDLFLATVGDLLLLE